MFSHVGFVSNSQLEKADSYTSQSKHFLGLDMLVSDDFSVFRALDEKYDSSSQQQTPNWMLGDVFLAAV